MAVDEGLLDLGDLRARPADPGRGLRPKAELESPTGPDEAIEAAELVKVAQMRVVGDVHPARETELQDCEQ